MFFPFVTKEHAFCSKLNFIESGGDMYQVNDTILYGTEGVCKITEIAKRDFGAGEQEYYILQPVHNGSSTIYVPLQNEKLVGKMRQILSKAEISDLIHAMPEEELLWYEDEGERKERYRQILAHGDRTELVRVIKTLYLHQKRQQQKGKHLRTADEHFFKEAERLLYDEFAMVLNISPEQVLPFIMEQIDKHDSVQAKTAVNE